MHHLPLIRLGFVSAIVVAPIARAQNTTRFSSAVDLGALMQRDGPDLWQSTTRLAPSLRLDQRWTQLSLDGSIVSSGQSVILNHGTLDAAFSPAPIGPLRLSVSGRAERLASSAYTTRSTLTMESSVSYATGAGGVWMGTAMERTPKMDSTIAHSLMMRAGFWQQFGEATISVTSTSHTARLGVEQQSYTQYDSIFNPSNGRLDSIVTSIHSSTSNSARTRLWSELEIGAAWAHGPVALDVAFGARPAVDVFPRALWGRVSAVVQATPAVAFIGSAGNDPARITMGTPQSRVASLGVRLSSASLLRPVRFIPARPVAAAFALKALGADAYVVSIHVPRARTVELSGDFGRWSPVALSETHPDTWETTLTLPPGTYRMNVRVDGDQWKAPPGMATVEDEFNGTVGIIVVH
ncbi:MAG: glycogen-binding domain-containing protein [bacterium]